MVQARTSGYYNFKGRILINIPCDGIFFLEKTAQWASHRKFEKIAFLTWLKFGSKMVSLNFFSFYENLRSLL